VLSRGKVGRATEPRLAGSRGSRRIRVTPPPPDQDTENLTDYPVHETNTGLTTRQARVSASRSRPPKGAEGKGRLREADTSLGTMLSEERNEHERCRDNPVGDRRSGGRSLVALPDTSRNFPPIPVFHKIHYLQIDIKNVR
jgi:hypothetical protein